MADSPEDVTQRVSVVVPVYRGAATIAGLVAELAEHVRPRPTPGGRTYVVEEAVLVWDHGPDSSDEVLRALEQEHDWVHVVWLSRNFGQHAATTAGMAAAGGDWIVTMDEDGQHDPAHIATLLDTAFDERARLVYGAPSNRPPHGMLRNLASRMVKSSLLRFLTGGDVTTFHSYRLLAGDVGRAVAAYAGAGVYLDVALSWFVSDVTSVKIPMRSEGRPATSYRFRALLSHFWRLALSSGNRPLRLVSGFGALCSAAGMLYALWLVIGRARGAIEVPGWTSTMVATLVIGGLVLICLGVIAEYVGVAATMSMGRPAFVVLEDPAERFGPPPRRDA
jgi:glycosyltransferase involved in cell wall biosynthesis